MTEPQPTVIQYSSAPQEHRLHIGEFIFQFIATGMFVALLLLPIRGMEVAKKVYEDFKLELPATTQLAFDVYDLLIDIRANYWLWGLPIVVPFLLPRLRPETRHRLLLLAVLLAGLLGYFVVMSSMDVMIHFLKGITSTTK